MKKTYMSPETSIILIATQGMIATSVDGFKSKLDDEDKITNPEDMLSRRNNVWEEQEEEDEDY